MECRRTMQGNNATDDTTDAETMTVAELSEKDTETLHSIYATARNFAANRHTGPDLSIAASKTAWNVEEVLAERDIPTEEVRSRYEAEEQEDE